MKNIVVTGVTGQDGFLAARKLLSEGNHVIGTSRQTLHPRLKSLQLNPNFKLVTTDLFDYSDVENLVKIEKPELILSFSGQSSVADSFKNPAETKTSIVTVVENFLKSLRALNSHAIFFNPSSSEIFGKNAAHADELSDFSPCSPYASAKMEAHKLVVNYRNNFDVKSINGILFNHESEFRDKKYFSRKLISGAVEIKKQGRGSISFGALSGVRDWGWAEEYVELILNVCRSDELDDYVISTGVGYSLFEFVSFVFTHLDLSVRDCVKFDSALNRVQDIEISIGNPSKLLKDFGVKPSVLLPEIVEKLVASEMLANVK